MSIVAKRCGVKFTPPSIIIIYENKTTGKMRKRVIPVRNFSQYSDCSRAAERLKHHVRHSVYLECVSLAQLERLHLLLRDHLQGASLEESLAAHRHQEEEEDLNKLSDEELSRRKAQMDDLFQRNRRRRGDPDFVYDLEVEFGEGSVKETCSWDEEQSDQEF